MNPKRPIVYPHIYISINNWGKKWCVYARLLLLCLILAKFYAISCFQFYVSVNYGSDIKLACDLIIGTIPFRDLYVTSPCSGAITTQPQPLAPPPAAKEDGAQPTAPSDVTLELRMYLPCDLTANNFLTISYRISHLPGDWVSIFQRIIIKQQNLVYIQATGVLSTSFPRLRSYEFLKCVLG